MLKFITRTCSVGLFTFFIPKWKYSHFLDHFVIGNFEGKFLKADEKLWKLKSSFFIHHEIFKSQKNLLHF